MKKVIATAILCVAALISCASAPTQTQTQTPEPPGEAVADSSEIYNGIGNEYYGERDYDKAIDAYTQAIRLNPNIAEAYFCRGNAYYYKNEIVKAAEDWAATLRINPKHPEARNNLRDVLKRI